VSRVAIMRAVQPILAAALAAYQVPVERDRGTPLARQETPRVIVLTGPNNQIEEYAGGAELREQVVTIECHEAVRDGDTAGRAEDAVMRLADLCRAALYADRTLGGAAFGLHITEQSDDGPRVELEGAVRGVAVVLQVRAYHT
jgi:hypothetical protein